MKPETPSERAADLVDRADIQRQADLKRWLVREIAKEIAAAERRGARRRVTA